MALCACIQAQCLPLPLGVQTAWRHSSRAAAAEQGELSHTSYSDISPNKEDILPERGSKLRLYFQPARWQGAAAALTSHLGQ